MKIKDLENTWINFKYPLNQISWTNILDEDYNSILISFYSWNNDIGVPYYVINILNMFNKESVSEEDIINSDVLFGPVLCQQPLLRGKNKWVDLLHLKKDTVHCFHPKFYAATSKRFSEDERENNQYYWEVKTSTYTASTFNEIGHLESPVIYSEFTLEVRIFLELLRLKNPDLGTNGLVELLKKALQESKMFENDAPEEIHQWTTQFVRENTLIPPPNLIEKRIRGKLNL